MQITFDGKTCGAELLMDIANVLSKEIDSPCHGYAQHREIRVQQFKALCNELTARDIDFTDSIKCPDSFNEPL